MEDMMRMYRMSGGDMNDTFPTDATLILNSNSSLIKRLGDIVTEDAENAEKTAKQIYTLALIAQRQLTAEELQNFLYDSFSMLEQNIDR